MAPLARYSVLLLVALSLATSAHAVIKPFWGGAQPLEPVANAIIAAWNAAAKKTPAIQVGAYDPSGTSNGIKGFYNGTYLIGAGSEPVPAAKETGQPAKITIPVAVAAYNFFVHGPSIVLSPAESYNIYSGAVTTWAQIPGANKKISGAIVRLSRSDKVGTTAIIQQLWTKAGTGYSGVTDGSPLTFSGLVSVATNAAMCNAVVARAGAIGYAHVSACRAQVLNKRFKGKIAEAALKNALGQALTSAQWNALAVLNTAPPAPTASWDNVDLIWKAIAKAPAAVSMQYVFVKTTLPRAGNGQVAKNFLVFALKNVAAVAAKYGFNKVPATWFNPSSAAVGTISVA